MNLDDVTPRKLTDLLNINIPRLRLGIAALRSGGVTVSRVRLHT